ncbi:MAG: hypothetical protein AAF403_08330, partial [Pseudomonadota bacterium]
MSDSLSLSNALFAFHSTQQNIKTINQHQKNYDGIDPFNNFAQHGNHDQQSSALSLNSLTSEFNVAFQSTTTSSYVAQTTQSASFASTIEQSQFDIRFELIIESLNHQCDCHTQSEKNILDQIEQQIDTLLYGPDGKKELDKLDEKVSALLNQFFDLIKKELDGNKANGPFEQNEKELSQSITAALRTTSNEQQITFWEHKLDQIATNRENNNLKNTNDKQLSSIEDALNQLFQAIENLYDNAPRERYLTLDQQAKIERLEQRYASLSNDDSTQFLGQNLLDANTRKKLDQLETTLDHLYRDELDPKIKSQEKNLIDQLNVLQDQANAQNRPLNEIE